MAEATKPINTSNKIQSETTSKGPNFRIFPLAQVQPDGSPIDLSAIQSICSHGLDECPPEDRAVAWLVLTHVYPSSPEEWPSFRDERIAQYKNYIDMLQLTGYENRIYPNTSEQSKFDLDNDELMELIHGDVIRTAHHLQFLPYADPDAPEPESPDDLLMPYHEQIRRMERILYVFSTLNRTLSYLQGFNELVIVIYYAYSLALNYFHDDFTEMEAFVFFTFQALMASTKLNELFTTQEHSCMIHNRLNEFMKVLQQHLPKTHKLITDLDIHPLCFCYRWLNLLFAQDYLMPNLMLIWDSIMSHFHELVEYNTYVAVAQVTMIEPLLTSDDQIEIITILQRTQVSNVQGLLYWANKFWDEDQKKKTLLAPFSKLKKLRLKIGKK